MKLPAFFLHAVAECESNVTQSTIVCNLAGITLQVVPHRSQCYGFSTVWISMCLFMWFMVINSSTHRAQRYELSPAWYFMCLCISFQQIKHLQHRAHWFKFFTGWHLTCFFMWWLNSKQLSHRAQCYVISLAWLFMCIIWWFLMILLNISSTRNHRFLQSAINRAKSCWILLASLFLFHRPGIILFSSNASSTWTGSFWVMLALLWLFHPPVIILFF